MPKTPNLLLERPERSRIDPLSQVFLAMRVKNSDCVRLEFGGTWGFRFEGYDHAHFGVISQGSCWLSMDEGEKALRLVPGDCWLLPQGRTHALRNQRSTPVRPYKEIQHKKRRGVVRHGRGTSSTTVIVGNFTFDGQSGKWLTDILPELIQFRMDDNRTDQARMNQVPTDQGSASAMHTILQLLALESQTESMGATIVVSRLADILFVQAVRAYVEQAGPRAAGWLKAIGDRQLRFALAEMHEAVERRWTVASLASSAGMSRSGFAARFKDLVGESPLEYLTRWRVYKATQLLRESDLKVAKVASLVGYESDAAFNRTFKKSVGEAPGEYRKSFRSRQHAKNRSLPGSFLNVPAPSSERGETHLA